MTYGSSAYAGARVAELHRTGAERRRASSAAPRRVALVVDLMRTRERRRSREAQLAVAPARH